MNKNRKMDENRTFCLSCGAPLSAPVFKSENFPASAQNIPDAHQLTEDAGILLRLCRCTACGLHQFDCTPVDYYKKVIRAVGLSPTMQELRRKDYEHLINTYHLEGKKFLECGCGNGDFLRVLTEFPVDITGMEYDPELAKAADALLKQTAGSGTCTGARVICMFPDTPMQAIPYGKFDCFLSFNFLEHQPDPLTMLRAMHYNLNENGIGLITVPSFEYIRKEARYYELIRDHIANYDLPALIFLCEQAGFTVIEHGFIGIGDTLRVVVRKTAAISPCPVVPRPEAASGSAETAAALQESLNRIRSDISAFIRELKASGKTLALWGAGHQGFTIASTTELGEYARYILDSAPFKQGKFAPASHLPICAPEYYLSEPVDVILIAAPGYVKEISGTIRELYKEKAPEIRSILDF